MVHSDWRLYSLAKGTQTVHFTIFNDDYDRTTVMEPQDESAKYIKRSYARQLWKKYQRMGFRQVSVKKAQEIDRLYR